MAAKTPITPTMIDFGPGFQVEAGDKQSIDAVIAYMREHGKEYGDTLRFYMYMEDECVYNAEQEQEFNDPSTAYAYQAFALVTLYTEWRREIGEEVWQRLMAYNSSTNGANVNGILEEYEALATEYGIRL